MAVRPIEPPMRVAREDDSIACYGQALRFASSLGFQGRTLWEIAITVSELATNAVRHARGGTVTMRALVDRPGIEITVEDTGPGIADMESAFVDGFSRGRLLIDDEILEHPQVGLGSGLGAVRRMMDSVIIENLSPGLRVTAVKYLP